jgi:hypothetical protein
MRPSFIANDYHIQMKIARAISLGQKSGKRKALCQKGLSIILFGVLASVLACV